MEGPPPPPPPHGQNPKTSSGLPPGKYEIFVIPDQRNEGGGFIYIPSMKPNVNSFVAGFATCMILVVLLNALKPVVLAWWSQARGSGGSTTVMLVCGIALGAWVLGRAQGGGSGGPADSGSAGGQSGGSQGGTYPGGQSSTYPGGYSHANGFPNGHAGSPPPPPPQSGPPPGTGGGPPPTSRHMPGDHGEPPPRPQWERPPPTPEPKPQPQTNPAAKAAWEKAREETRKKEEERKAKEAEQKRREELEKKIKAMREKEAQERLAREKKKEEEEEKLKAQKKADERAKELAEVRAKLAERRAAEAAKKVAADKEAAIKKAAEEAATRKTAEQASKPPTSTYAFSSVGERMSPWPNGRPPSPKPVQKPKPQPTPPASPKKPPPPPTAKTYLGTDDDAYSYRPYDKPKRPTHVKSPSSIYSESSYASQTTSKTTPPNSHRGPYSTKDPDKIVIKAVYAFTNAYVKTPTSQLISGLGSVTDGLILRITTEGLFIDDDVRGVPQREWDVKAWTMKLVEVWCPSFRQGSTGTASARAASTSSPSASQSKNFRRLWGLDKEKAATSEETDALVVDMLMLCKNNCRLRAAAAGGRESDVRSYATSSVYSASSAASSDRDSVFSADDRTNQRGARQTGENKNARLHVLRASIRDQEGKKYVFVITEEESWKVAVGLQKLRKGTQVRALGVSGMTANDARTTLENLGWA